MNTKNHSALGEEEDSLSRTAVVVQRNSVKTTSYMPKVELAVPTGILQRGRQEGKKKRNIEGAGIQQGKKDPTVFERSIRNCYASTKEAHISV